jgi:hypothetical protein
MKRFFTVCISAMFLSISALCQHFGGTEYNGKLESVSGESFLGDIFFDPATGKVTITNEKGSNHFTSRTASYFEYYDFEKNSIRKFFSLLYNNNPAFFELLKETSNLALLAKENVSSSRAIAYLAKASADNSSEAGIPTLSVKQNSETLYLADEKGNIKPYVVINKGEKIGTISNYVSPYLLSTLTRGKYQEIRKFARENHYSLKDKEDLIEVLSFYDEIARN